MKFMNRSSILSAFLLATLLGCAGPATTQSGFLPDYDRLYPDPRGGDASLWVARSEALREYTGLWVEPVEFWVDSDSRGGLRKADLDRLEETMRTALADESKEGEGLPLVDRPGEGVLRVRVALTRIVPTRPILNTVTQLPPVRMASMATKLLTGTHLGVGHVAIEAELSDSVTGEVLVEFVDVHVGSKMEVLDGMVTWAQIEDGLQGWAEGLQGHLAQRGKE